MIKGDGMNDLEKKVRAALILCVIVVGIYLAGKCRDIWERESDGQGGRILGQAYVQAGTLAAESFLPVLSYGQEQTPEDFFSAVLRTVGEQFPILSFQKTDCGEEEIIEDAETAEAIREENEKLIAQKLEAENQAQAVTEENQQAQETQSDGAAETQNETAQAQETSQIPEGTATQKQVEIPREQLTDFNYLLNNFFVVDPTTTALGKDMKLEKNPEQPQILIYHTHSQEGFADSVEGDTSTTVIGVGDYLVQLLQERYGYQVLHITDTFDIVDGQLDRSAAYNYAEPVISQALQEHPTIEVVIDLHRDGVDESKHLVTEVNGKPTAQVMFFNGLSRTNQNGEISYLPNPYIEDNLAFSFQLEYLAKQYYPEYTRCIYLKGYRYNLHLKPRSLLLEVGAQTNTVEEAKNAMEPFADLLYKVLSGSGTG